MHDAQQWRTYVEVHDAAEQTGRRLAALGVVAGAIVPTMVPTANEAIDIWFGLNRMGAADLPINNKYRGDSLISAVNMTGSRVAVVHTDHLDSFLKVSDRLRDLRTIAVVGGELRRGVDHEIELVHLDAVRPSALDLDAPIHSQVATVLLTSGTTGPSKGVMMPHGQVVTHARQACALVDLTDGDIFFSAHPLFHMAGKLTAVLGSLMAGARVVLAPQFNPGNWLRDIRDAGATVTLGHGPLLELIHRGPRRADDGENPLRALAAGGVAPALAAEFAERYQVPLAETYGMSELNIVASSRYDETRPVGSAGRVDSDLYDVRIVDTDTDIEVAPGEVGEIAVRPRIPWTTTLGYLGMPERTVEAWRNLWMHTGDMGRIDEAGYLYFSERQGERIRRKAENISSFDIESVVSRFDGVAECAAVGVPSELAGDDAVKVCLVLAEGANVDFLDLLRHCVQGLPHFMVPRYFEVLDSMPRTPTAKIQKSVLRQRGVSTATWDRHAAGIRIRELAENVSRTAEYVDAGGERAQR